MTNASALFNVMNGIYIVLGNSFYYAVWILKCYRSSSLLSLFLPLVSRSSDLPSKALCIVSSCECWMHSHQLALYGQLIREYDLIFLTQVN